MKRIMVLSLSVMVVVAQQHASAANGGVDVKQVVQATEAFLDELNDYEELSLAVMIAKDGVPVFTKAYGTASRSFAVPNNIDTKFNLASMNKMFTAVAIMQLVQQGRLGVHDKVGDHIPDYPNDEVRNEVTVYQLLTHTSGMGNIFGEVYNRTPVNRFQTIEDFLPLFVDDPLRFTPGSKYEYSNAGYIVLGHLIERITKQDYHSYVKQNIFLPAGMNDTDCYDVQYPIPNLAIGYSRSSSRSEEFEYRTIEFMKMTKGGPAGGGYSTVGDLIRFGAALLENVLLNEEYTDLATTGKVAVDDIWQGGDYCFGLLEQKINGHRILGHSGNFAGIRSTLKIYVDDGVSLAILSNFDRDQGAEELEYFIREKINGETDFTKSYLQSKRIIRRIELGGYAAGVEEYDRMRDDVQLYEGLINSRGYFLLRRRKPDKAVELFKFNVFAFPNSSNACDSLAEAYSSMDDKENAIRYYKKALEIDPDLESALEGLETLGAAERGES
jgi:CubicO group peptidase (beta-lactamase class C family)